MPLLTTLFLLCIGLALGSFISALTWRWPRGEDIVLARSRCTACGTALPWYRLIPLLSWVQSGGRCHACKGRIGWRYPVIELLSAVWLVASMQGFGMPWSASEAHMAIHEQWTAFPWANVLLAATGLLLLTMAVIDAEHRIVPHLLLAAFAGCAVLWAWQVSAYPVTAHLWGALVAAALAEGLRLGFRRLRQREALGAGDVWFFALAGLWLGWQALPLFLGAAGLGGVVTGIIWARRHADPRFPFIPALVFALLTVTIMQQMVHDSVLHLPLWAVPFFTPAL